MGIAPVIIGNCVLYHGDCLEVLPSLDCAADAVITDPPYGMTHCVWDKAPDLPRMWDCLIPAARENAAFCLFAQQPFMTDLIASNRKMFRYDLIMEKQKATGFLNSRRMPLRKHEHIGIFYRAQPTYNPQKFHVGTSSRRKGNGSEHKTGNVYRKGLINWDSGYGDGSRFPVSVIRARYEGVFFDSHKKNKILHPTQKPLSIMEWLVKTYSDRGDLILDPFMGSGTTAIAAMRSGRRFIGIEMDGHWFNAACARVAKEIEDNGLLNIAQCEQAALCN